MTMPVLVHDLFPSMHFYNFRTGGNSDARRLAVASWVCWPDVACYFQRFADQARIILAKHGLEHARRGGTYDEGTIG